jgi:cytochrome c oxidase subunit I+III
VPTALVTRLHDALPDHVALLPTPSLWPLLTALATTGLFIGTVFTHWALIWGSIPVGITLIGWFWPTAEEARRHRAVEIKPQTAGQRELALGELMS